MTACDTNVTEDKLQRIGRLKGIIKSYKEDEKMFGLTAIDLCRLANFKTELSTLEAE